MAKTESAAFLFYRIGLVLSVVTSRAGFQDPQDFQAGVFGTIQGGLHFPRQSFPSAQQSDTHQPRPWHWGQKARLWLDVPTTMNIGRRRLLGILGLWSFGLSGHGPPQISYEREAALTMMVFSLVL